MAKSSNTIFFCKECGYESSKWSGFCPACSTPNSMVEAPKAGSGRGRLNSGNPLSQARPVSLSEIQNENQTRFSTGFEELDRVLGGGLLPGSLVLTGGDPGIGKSTLLLQMCRHMALSGRKVLYVSGEESLSQLKLRAVRLGEFEGDLRFLCETDMDRILEILKEEVPAVAVIDSIQTMAAQSAASAPGSVTQVRECTNMILNTAKSLGISVFIVGHVTKDGAVAGPKLLEHMVDTVLYFEGDRHASYRILRGVKNRFGASGEIAVFEMLGSGLKEIPNPSAYMLSGRPENTPGACVTCVIEGSRPILAEIQALVTPTSFNVPRRNANGVDYNRAMMLLAVLEKRSGYRVNACDAYLNVIGGLYLNEPGADLAIVLALASSYKDKPIGDDLVALGEVGLTGELRSVSQMDTRLAEIARLGFKRCVVPAQGKSKLKIPAGLQVQTAKTLYDAIKIAFAD